MNLDGIQLAGRIAQFLFAAVIGMVLGAMLMINLRLL